MSAQASPPRNCGKLSARAELRCAKHQLQVAQAALTTHGASSTSHHSPGYWRWQKRKAQRWIREAHRRLAHPPIAHLQLWLCIHAKEGSWDNADTGHNGHYGGLQMTSPWGRGVYYVYRADWLTPYQQMRKAELGYMASGYSQAWLLQQWYHPECVGYA